MTAERLDKLISDSGLYSRSEARSLIRAGRVDVDGETVRTPERRFARECTVRVDGSTINCAKYRYFMLDKPKGYVCANEDSTRVADTGNEALAVVDEGGNSRATIGDVHNFELLVDVCESFGESSLDFVVGLAHQGHTLVADAHRRN